MMIVTRRTVNERRRYNAVGVRSRHGWTTHYHEQDATGQPLVRGMDGTVLKEAGGDTGAYTNESGCVLTTNTVALGASPCHPVDDGESALTAMTRQHTSCDAS